MSPFVPTPRPCGLPRGFTWPVATDPEGRDGPTCGQARGGDWRRTSHGLYVPARAERTVDQRIVEAAAVLPRYGGITGWAALRWLGGVWFEGLTDGGRAERPVVLATAGRSIRAQPGIDVTEERLAPHQLTTHRGLSVTTAAYALFLEMRRARTVAEAIVAADMAAYSDLVSRSEVVAFIGLNPGWTGVARARQAADEMEENAWSPKEVDLRLLWQRYFPRPACNRPVFDVAGRFIGTPDVLDVAAGVAGDYDGTLHLEGAQRARDVRREGLFRGAGLEYVTMLAADLRYPDGFLVRLREAYRRAARVPIADRRWTAELPSWWVPTFTVDQRRDLDAEQRARWLRLRLAVG